MAAPLIFLAYASRDRRAGQAVRRLLLPLLEAGALRLWDASRLSGGDVILAERRAALAEAGHALLLVSADALAEGLAAELLAARQQSRLKLHWLPLRPCVIQGSGLEALAPLLAEPVSPRRSPGAREQALVDGCQALLRAVGVPEAQVAALPAGLRRRALRRWALAAAAVVLVVAAMGGVMARLLARSRRVEPPAGAVAPAGSLPPGPVLQPAVKPPDGQFIGGNVRLKGDRIKVQESAAGSSQQTIGGDVVIEGNDDSVQTQSGQRSAVPDPRSPK